MGYGRHTDKGHPAVPVCVRISPNCPRDFYASRDDKHSDLRSKASVTVMAVAADLHRNFLITESTERYFRQRSDALASFDEPCYSFALIL